MAKRKGSSRIVSVSIPDELYIQAKREGINISRAAQIGLMQEVWAPVAELRQRVTETEALLEALREKLLVAEQRQRAREEAERKRATAPASPFGGGF